MQLVLQEFLKKIKAPRPQYFGLCAVSPVELTPCFRSWSGGTHHPGIRPCGCGSLETNGEDENHLRNYEFSQTTEWWISGSSIFWNFVLHAYVPHKIQATAPAPWLPWPRKSRNPMGTRCPTNGGHRPTRPTPRPSFGPHDPAAPTSARWRLDPPKIYLHLSTWYVYIIYHSYTPTKSISRSIVQIQV